MLVVYYLNIEAQAKSTAPRRRLTALSVLTQRNVEMYPVYTENQLEQLNRNELRVICKQMGAPCRITKAGCIVEILAAQPQPVAPEPVTPEFETSPDLDREAIAFVASRDTGNTYDAEDIEGMQVVEHGFLNIYIKGGGMVPVHRENFSVILSFRTQIVAAVQAEDIDSEAIAYKEGCCVGSDDAANGLPPQVTTSSTKWEEGYARSYSGTLQLINKATEPHLEFYLAPRPDQKVCLSYGASRRHSRYIITQFRHGGYSCTCHDNQYRKHDCKHIKGLRLAIPQTREPEFIRDSVDTPSFDIKVIWWGEKPIVKLFSRDGLWTYPNKSDKQFKNLREAAKYFADAAFSEAVKWQETNQLLSCH